MNDAEHRRNAARGTTLRFVVLLFVLLSSCLTMLYRAALAVRSESDFRTCVRASGADPDAPVWQVNLSIWFDDDFESCRVETTSEALRLALLGTATVVLVAVAVYWLIPLWRVRRARLLPAADFDEPSAPAPSVPRPRAAVLPPAEGGWFDLRALMERVLRESADPGSPWRDMPLSGHLAALADRAEVTREPRFVVDIRPAKASTAVAFGRAGRYFVALPAALLKERTHTPRDFEAVVLHELAHIRNRDVDITYLTVALWRTYCVLVLLPYAVLQGWLVFQETVLGRARIYWADATPWLGEVLYAAFLVAQVQLSRADVLRSRELCADLDAVASGADTAVWRKAAGDRDTEYRGGRLPHWAPAAAGWFRGLWRTHPDWRHRYRTVTRSTPSDPGGNWLQVVLFVSSLLVLMRVPIAQSRSWAEEVLHGAIYVAVPLLVAAWFAVRPPKRKRGPGRGGPLPGRDGERDTPPADRLTPHSYAYTYTASGHPVREPEPRLRREPLPRRPLILVALAIGTLLVADPLSVTLADPYGRDALEALQATKELPPAYQPEPLPTVNEETRAQVAAWSKNGGQAAVTALTRALAGRPSGFEDMVDKGPRRYVPAVPEGYCRTVRQALAAAGEEPRYPEAHGRESWESALKNARSGSDILCAPALADAPPNQVFALEIHFLTADSALSTFRLRLEYSRDGLPTGSAAPPSPR
jgi:Zn-dependent protease with chaperone function